MVAQFVERVRSLVSTRRAERMTLLYGLFTGLLGVVLAANEFREGTEIDYQAYYFAGKAVVQGEPFVGWAITDGAFITEKAYVYTPITAPIFSVYGMFPDWRIGYVLNVILLISVFYMIGRLLISFVERHGGSLSRVDRILIMGFCLFSGHSVLGVYRGNVDPIMLLMLSVGLLAIERGEGWKGGTLWATAAHFKLFPAFLGVWLLYRRAYRAIAAAMVTGIGLIVLGTAVFGIDAHIEFVDFIVNERSRKGAFQGGLDPTLQWITLRRPFSQFLALSGNQLFVVTTALISPFVYLVYRDANSELDRIVAFFATMVAMLITIIPSTLNYVVYLYFPLLGLLYLTEDSTTKQLFVAGLVLVNLPLYPQHIELIVDALPLGAGIGDILVEGARAFMTYSSIPLIGFLCILAGCIRFVRVPRPTTSTTATEQPSPE
ncbi:glycosyltransferase family 87 protein [Halovenus rubra]|uniref:Glycosyltransferase family 87 protein n=2 Tax=Halovenus rubra TaxID=869890 RepID=A0ABD5XAJ3_9EURY|nr:glycosyltransferase family 87 protein [Halovenus rubra]